MERKGGCCLAPRSGAEGQAWQMGNIMLKFRPIAPKPAAMAPAPAAGAGRGKRKRKAAAAAGGAGRRGRKPRKANKPLPSPSSSSSSSSSGTTSSTPPPPATHMHASSLDKAADLAPAHVAALHALRPVPSCVTVEDVTATWRDGEAPPAPACGGEDEAPAFVSDRWGRVTWMNLAFSRAVSASDAGLVLAARDGAAVPAWGACAGFTCRVRVTYASPRPGSLVAPCDVWRIGDGGYLWRLDLQATLTLSLGGLM
ncbi:hypothetical protein ACQ4PT_046431 [Festuca glaucescens]